HPHHQRLVPQRAHLSRRNVQDLAHGQAGRTRLCRDGICRRHPRSLPPDVGVRQGHSSCKSCVSTAMPLCHWPCSCYPNYSLDQTGDWMNEIYPLWVAAHGILIVTPVNWYHVPGGLKAMMDRLVCADGGNPDPTSTHGKNADEAKALELKGWPYPRHLAGRHFGLIVHGDSVGAE